MEHEILFSATSIALDSMKRTIYLSTPLTTISNTRAVNQDNARRYIRRLRAVRSEYNVINPVELIDIEGWYRSDYIRFWKAFMDQFVDTIVMAPGWEESAGCIMERTHAVGRSIEIFEYKEIVG